MELTFGSKEQVNKKGEYLFLMLLMSAIVLFYSFTMRPGHPWADDFGQYVQQARNISDGAPYDRVVFVFHKDEWNAGPRIYPPGFPLLLAPIYHEFGLDLRPMKFLVLVFFIGSLVVIYFTFRHELGSLAAVGLIAVIGFNPFFWDLKDYVLSDIPFLFLCYLALLLTQEAVLHEVSGSRFFGYSALAGLVMYAACSTRTVGILMIPAAFVWSLIRQRRIMESIATIVAICTVLAIGEAVVLHTVQGYLRAHAATHQAYSASPIIGQVLSFTRFYLGSLSLLWNSGHSSKLRVTFFIFTVAMMFTGMAIQFLRNLRVHDVFALFYVSTLFLWGETRYLIPLIPLYLFYTIRGVLWLTQWAPSRITVFIYSVLVIFIVLTYTADYRTLDLHHLAFGTASPETQQMFAFMKTQTTQDDVIEFFAPRTFSLYTERRSSEYPQIPTPSKADLSHYFCRVGITFVVTSPLIVDPVLSDFVASNHDSWLEPFSNSMFDVYKVPDRVCRESITDAR
jgi:Dolichyl-phosphate-mannose-protein mannosyltransferase